MNAPMSMQVVPIQTRCEMMRDSSIAITRSTVQRGVISMPNSRSAPSTKATLFPMRVEVVLAVGPRDDLVVLPVLADLLEAAVQVADVRDAAHHGLAVELEHQPQHAVRGRMLRADVDEHVLALELRLEPRRLQRASCPRAGDHERHALRLPVAIRARSCDSATSMVRVLAAIAPILPSARRRAQALLHVGRQVVERVGDGEFFHGVARLGVRRRAPARAARSG